MKNIQNRAIEMARAGRWADAAFLCAEAEVVDPVVIDYLGSHYERARRITGQLRAKSPKWHEILDYLGADTARWPAVAQRLLAEQAGIGGRLLVIDLSGVDDDEKNPTSAEVHVVYLYEEGKLTFFTCCTTSRVEQVNRLFGAQDPVRSHLFGWLVALAVDVLNAEENGASIRGGHVQLEVEAYLHKKTTLQRELDHIEWGRVDGLIELLIAGPDPHPEVLAELLWPGWVPCFRLFLTPACLDAAREDLADWLTVEFSSADVRDDADHVSRLLEIYDRLDDLGIEVDYPSKNIEEHRGELDRLDLL